VRVLWITGVAVAIVIAVALVVILGSVVRVRGAVLSALALLIVFSYGRVRAVADGGKNVWADGKAVQDVMEVLPEGSVVRYLIVPTSQQPSATHSRQRQRLMLYQFYLPHVRFEVDDGGPEDRSRFVFAPSNTTSLLRDGAAIRWQDPGAAIALWELPPTGATG
jgi:hypothetical protein